MKRAKVLIVDDHALYREGVRNAIAHEADIEVVGEAQDGVEALAKARELKPDLILMDVRLPRCSGLEALSAIKRESPQIKIIMLTVGKEEHLPEATKRGADGVLGKNLRAGDLLNRMRNVMRGEVILS